MTIHTITQLRKKLPAFREFLAARGAEVLEPTNEWEVVRFRAAGATAVIYTNGSGRITPSGATAKAAMDAFVSGGKWTAGVGGRRRSRRPPEVTALLARDGDSCFLCRQPLGDDITVDHLVPVTAGGPNHLANMALAHKACNLRMGHLSVMEKIALREQIGSTP